MTPTQFLYRGEDGIQVIQGSYGQTECLIELEGLYLQRGIGKQWLYTGELGKQPFVKRFGRVFSKSKLYRTPGLLDESFASFQGLVFWWLALQKLREKGQRVGCRR